MQKKRPRSSPPARQNTRFDPGAVAVAGIVILCLLTGAAIIMGPSLFRPSPPESSASDISPVAPPPVAPSRDGPPPDAPRIELVMAQPASEAVSDRATDNAKAAETTPGEAGRAPEELLYDPYINDLEGIGEGDISYPDGFSDSENTAAEMDLALLGPAAHGEINPLAPSLSIKQAAPPRAPTLKPAPERAAPVTMSALLSGMPELVDQITDHFKDCEQCPDMVAIAPGAFVMGPLAGDRPRANEGPATPVELKQGFAIAAREVTFAEWDACVEDGGCAGHKAEDFGWGRGDQPVVDVSFEDAQNYIAWLSRKTGERYRLPSEAEWEYAARAGSDAPFSFGEDLSARNANYDGRFAYRGKKGRWIGRPTPASRYPANAFGLFDMHGNVWEWTADCWRKSLTGLPVDGRPRGGACASRVLKGGAFNTGGWRLRAAHRIGKPASAREMEIGFRVVREL